MGSRSFFSLAADVIQLDFPALTSNRAGQQSSKNHVPQAALMGLQTVKGTAALHLPTVNEAVPLVGANYQPSFFVDWYNRIHISAAVLALGNVVSEQDRTVYIWNAWLTKSVTLNALEAINAGGINVGQPAAPPLEFTILQERAYQIAATTGGPPVINATLTWDFGADGTVSTVITGNRITAWTIGPDWSNQVLETFEYMTDLEQAYDGTEVRTTVRETPRRKWSFSAMAWAANKSYAENAIFNWNKRIWAMPVFTDMQTTQSVFAIGQTVLPCTTTDLDFAAGELAILLSDPQTFEVLQVLSVQSDSITLQAGLSFDWPRGTKLYPMRKARFTKNPVISRGTSSQWVADVEFQSSESNPMTAYTGWTTYRGLPVLEDHMDWSDDPQMSYDIISNSVDNATGIPVVYQQTAVTQPVQAFNWRLFSKAQRTVLKGMIESMKGRVGVLWLPTWAEDFTVAATIAGTSTGLIVEACGYSLYVDGAQNRRDIRIELWDGTVLYRHILSSTDLLNGTEQINLGSPLGQTLTADKFKMVCFMTPVRFDTDTFELYYDTDSLMTLGTSFRGVPDNV